jgi:hypothetical protein
MSLQRRLTFAGNGNYNSAALYQMDTIALPTDLTITTQSALNVYKSGAITATVQAVSANDLATINALATGGFAFRFVYTDSKGTDAVAASLVAGSYTGGTSFAVSYQNTGASSPLNSLVDVVVQSVPPPRAVYRSKIRHRELRIVTP